jgi:hypothetical protein
MFSCSCLLQFSIHFGRSHFLSFQRVNEFHDVLTNLQSLVVTFCKSDICNYLDLLVRTSLYSRHDFKDYVYLGSNPGWFAVSNSNKQSKIEFLQIMQALISFGGRVF